MKTEHWYGRYMVFWNPARKRSQFNWIYGLDMFRLPSWKLTYPPEKSILKMMFLFPRWDMYPFPRGYEKWFVEFFTTTQLPSINRSQGSEVGKFGSTGGCWCHQGGGLLGVVGTSVLLVKICVFFWRGEKEGWTFSDFFLGEEICAIVGWKMSVLIFCGVVLRIPGVFVMFFVCNSKSWEAVWLACLEDHVSGCK